MALEHRQLVESGRRTLRWQPETRRQHHQQIRVRIVREPGREPSQIRRVERLRDLLPPPRLPDQTARDRQPDRQSSAARQNPRRGRRQRLHRTTRIGRQQTARRRLLDRTHRTDRRIRVQHPRTARRHQQANPGQPREPLHHTGFPHVIEHDQTAGARQQFTQPLPALHHLRYRPGIPERRQHPPLNLTHVRARVHLHPHSATGEPLPDPPVLDDRTRHRRLPHTTPTDQPHTADTLDRQQTHRPVKDPVTRNEHRRQRPRRPQPLPRRHPHRPTTSRIATKHPIGRIALHRRGQQPTPTVHQDTPGQLHRHRLPQLRRTRRVQPRHPLTRKPRSLQHLPS